MEEGTIGSIPGMGIDQSLMEQLKGKNKNTVDLEAEQELPMIPGLDFGIEEEKTPEKIVMQRKVPYSKPIPRQFQQSWMDTTNKRPPSIYRIDHSGEMADDHPTGLQHGMKGPHDERHFEDRGPPMSGFGDSDLRQMGDSDLREPPNLPQGPMVPLNHSQGPMGPSNHHQGPMGPPSHLKGQMGTPNQLGPPPLDTMGPPKFPIGLPQSQNSMGPPLSQRGPPRSMGPPQIPTGQMGPPQGQMGSHPPPMGNEQDFLHPMGPPNMFQGPSQRTSQTGGLQRPPMGSRPPIRQQHDFPEDNDYGEPLSDRDMRMMGDDFHRKRDWDLGPGIDEREFHREDFPNEDFRPDFNQGGDFRDEGEDRMFGGQRGGGPGRSRGRGRGRARGRGRGGRW